MLSPGVQWCRLLLWGSELLLSYSPAKWGLFLQIHVFAATLGSGFLLHTLVWFGSVHETGFVVKQEGTNT